MTTQTGATTEHTSHTEGAHREVSRDVTKLYQEGLVAGLVGAATVALWFLLVDSVQGRPLYTPTVLGSALFSRGAGVPWADALPNIEMVLMFTWVHGLIFVVIGGIAAHLLGLAERQPSIGFGIFMMFVVFEFVFTAGAMLFAAPVLQALAWPAIVVANLLAAAAMGGYFWLRHPNLRVQP
jgi:hypothetical protein